MSEAVKTLMAGYKGLLSQMAIFDKEKVEKVDQVDFLREVEGRCRVLGGDGGEGERVLLFLVKEAYEGDVVEEEGVLSWWEAGGGLGEGRKMAEPYVEWLREADEESEDDDEEEEEESDGEE